jgi:hypothetical protein
MAQAEAVVAVDQHTFMITAAGHRGCLLLAVGRTMTWACMTREMVLYQPISR